MAKRPSRELMRKRIAKVRWSSRCDDRTPGRRVSAFKIQVGRSCVILCPLSFRVQTNHSRFIQRAFQTSQNCDCVRARGRFARRRERCRRLAHGLRAEHHELAPQLPLLRPLRRARVTVVSRLRKDAALRTVPCCPKSCCRSELLVVYERFPTYSFLPTADLLSQAKQTLFSLSGSR